MPKWWWCCLLVAWWLCVGGQATPLSEPKPEAGEKAEPGVEYTTKTKAKGQAKGQAKDQAKDQAKSSTEEAADSIFNAAMASGNPTLMAAGVALKAARRTNTVSVQGRFVDFGFRELNLVSDSGSGTMLLSRLADMLDFWHTEYVRGQGEASTLSSTFKKAVQETLLSELWGPKNIVSFQLYFTNGRGQMNLFYMRFTPIPERPDAIHYDRGLFQATCLPEPIKTIMVKEKCNIFECRTRVNIVESAAPLTTEHIVAIWQMYLTAYETINKIFGLFA